MIAELSAVKYKIQMNEYQNLKYCCRAEKINSNEQHYALSLNEAACQISDTRLKKCSALNIASKCL
jgi:hypothetical protein